jgi:hypothetical protein
MEYATSPPLSFSKSRVLWFFLLLALVNLMWASRGTAVKFLEGKLGPIAITFLLFYLTPLLLVPLLVARCFGLDCSAPNSSQEHCSGFPRRTRPGDSSRAN